MPDSQLPDAERGVQPLLRKIPFLQVLILVAAIPLFHHWTIRLPDRVEVGARTSEIVYTPVSLASEGFAPLRLAGAWKIASEDPRWEHQRWLLVEEFNLRTPLAGLHELPAVLDKVAAAVQRSKAKDDDRGRQIIEDYAQVHCPADEDPVVRECREETHRLQAEVDELLTVLEGLRETRDGRPGLRLVAAGSASDLLACAIRPAAGE